MHGHGGVGIFSLSLSLYMPALQYDLCCGMLVVLEVGDDTMLNSIVAAGEAEGDGVPFN